MATHMHSLETVAAECLPTHWTDSVRWLARRLNRGDLRGSRFGRTWMMSDADIEYLIQKHRNIITPVEAQGETPLPRTGSVTFIEGLSDRSRSRLRRRPA